MLSLFVTIRASPWRTSADADTQRLWLLSKLSGAKEGSSIASYKVEVDRTKCVACGTCYSGNCPLFESDEAGYARVSGGTNDEKKSSKVFNDSNMEQAKATAGYCPVLAIIVTEA